MLTLTTTSGLKQSIYEMCSSVGMLRTWSPASQDKHSSIYSILVIQEKAFSSHPQAPIQGLYLVTSVLVTNDLQTAAVSMAVIEAGEFYAVDLPNLSSLIKSEVHRTTTAWYMKWKTEEKDHGSSALPSSLSSTLTKSLDFI